MTKYVISEFSESGGITQEVVVAESKLQAMLQYFNVVTDADGHFYLDLESVVADHDRELGYDINIIKIVKTKKLLDPGYTPWPFPTERPE